MKRTASFCFLSICDSLLCMWWVLAKRNMVSNKSLIHLLVLLIFFLCLVSLDSATAIRVIESKNEKFDVVLPVAKINEMSTVDQTDMEEMNLIGRMDFKMDDYPYTEANSRHNPKNPNKP